MVLFFAIAALFIWYLRYVRSILQMCKPRHSKAEWFAQGC